MLFDFWDNVGCITNIRLFIHFCGWQDTQQQNSMNCFFQRSFVILATWAAFTTTTTFLLRRRRRDQSCPDKNFDMKSFGLSMMASEKCLDITWPGDNLIYILHV